MAEKTLTSIRARGIIMIPRTGNNDLSDDKNEFFFALPLDAGWYGPILFATAVADRG
ncbi:hypothetical protein [Serratia proteamaculans]|jgi:hypothetical protein|uniref:Uncharacterized protein n=1 Tax=Serratia proteamaculans TaxID=28151 RepID=A0ABS0TS78_SERPR|nr:hypothetical protein [Serratia proteamaculans]MBI6180170.1 hypothetical protein [Serratia proteamaculans]